MKPDHPLELSAELLDDFYAECDELLGNIRSGVAELEARGDDRVVNSAAVEGLFRNMHSLKGISAIVGLRVAEQLAHGAEDLLRAVSRHTTSLTPEALDGLMQAAQRLAQIVHAHRHGKTLPEADDLLRQFSLHLRREPSPAGAAVETPPPRPEAAPAAGSDPVATARRAGLALFVASFTPRPALDARGVNVNAVRERFKAVGEIIRATPSVRGPGSIVFEFVVAVRETPSDLAAWEEDGVTFAALPESGPVPAAVASEPAKSAVAADPGFGDSLTLTPSHIVRVDLARLDELMRIAGEMVIQRSRLEERIAQSSAGDPGLKEINLALARSLREMREAIASVRMVPVAEIFTRMPFVVRDLARSSAKKARVVLEGQQTEVDKYLVERLKEPLLHLVRNAFSHGIESPAERVAAGKPPEATILLRARSAGESVLIQIRDDGRGVDVAAVAARATALGLPVPDRLDGPALLKILCAPGFSTREEADLASGRGVGMAVVANTVRELGGTLTLETTPGGGAEFTLKLPLTLSIADAILVSVADQTCAVPQGAVDEILQIAASEERRIHQTAVIPYRGSLLPLVRLRKLFQRPDAATETLTLLVLSTERGAVGLVVDRVRGQREIVIRPLADPLLHVPGISGATELGDGRPILILDPGAVTQGVVRPSADSNSVSFSTAARAS